MYEKLYINLPCVCAQDHSVGGLKNVLEKTIIYTMQQPVYVNYRTTASQGLRLNNNSACIMIYEDTQQCH